MTTDAPPPHDSLACPLCGEKGRLEPRTDGERYDCGACLGTFRARLSLEPVPGSGE